jgi:hypothetical protein
VADFETYDLTLHDNGRLFGTDFFSFSSSISSFLPAAAAAKTFHRRLPDDLLSVSSTARQHLAVLP